MRTRVTTIIASTCAILLLVTAVGYTQSPSKMPSSSAEYYDMPVEGVATLMGKKLFRGITNYLQMKARAGRTAIGDERMRTLLQFLDERGGQQMIPAVVQALAHLTRGIVHFQSLQNGSFGRRFWLPIYVFYRPRV